MEKYLQSTATIVLTTTQLVGTTLRIHPVFGVDAKDTFFGMFSFYYHDVNMNQIDDIIIDNENYFYETFLPNLAKFAKIKCAFYNFYPEDETENLDFDDNEILERLYIMDRSVLEETIILLQEAMELGLIELNDDIISIDASETTSKNIMQKILGN